MRRQTDDEQRWRQSGHDSFDAPTHAGWIIR
jgi:hypothetical protein